MGVATLKRKNHNNPARVLPNFRRLGVALRIIFAVEGAALLVAYATSSAADTLTLFFDRSAVLQPALLLCLLLLYLLHPSLGRLPYAVGAIITGGIAAGTATVFTLWLDHSQPQTPGALDGVLFSTALCLLLLNYFHLRERAFSPALSEARLQALQARIRPHFFFNSLNAVLSLIRQDPRRAERALENLADLFRALMSEVRSLAPLTDEVALARAYLEIESLRLGERLQVRWFIDHMPADALIPRLIIQPLVENAVYHGIEPRSTGGEISLNLYRSQDKVHIVIRNDCGASPQSPHQGNRLALANIEERLLLHFDLDATLKSERQGAVYQVNITLPYTRDRSDRPAQPGHR